MKGASKGYPKGKGKGGWWGKGFNQFIPQYSQNKGKGKGDQKGWGAKGDSNNTAIQKGKGKGGGFQGVCHWCWEWGHSERFCPQK